ncbi:MAG: hypothetical protein J1E97_04385 [Muribaculaceae bacterium]|nr:hypothetical protein [Muribaculaceae bacterium]
MRPKALAWACTLLSMIAPLGACTQLNDERIPAYAVSIDLSNAGLWNTFGVFNFGDCQYFVIPLRLPGGFNYIYNSATGYGGVLLVMGLDNYTGGTAPLAYDMACPVERLPEVRVWLDPDSETFEVECQECHSRYNVVDGVGAPVSGPAKAMKYALTPYQCYPTINGGYIITR